MKSPTLDIYDTTLRDGAQGAGISFSVADKLKIALRLDELGVTHIEGGWPGATPKDTVFFDDMKTVKLSNAILCAFGATRRPNVKAEDDEQVRGLLRAETSIVTLVGKTWDRQIGDVLRTTLDENLAMIADTVAALRAQGREVFFDAEHFFDGYASNPEYAVRGLDAAISAGASRIVLCDTNGGTLPHQIETLVPEMIARFGNVVGIHCHDDAGVAVANSLAAIRSGAVHVQGCVNGYGERAGNANLCTVIPNLQLKMDRRVLADDKLASLTETSRYVAEIANMAPYAAAPYVGESAFTHKGGQHVDAVMKAAYAYQHIDPAIVGNRRRVIISDQSGKATVLAKGADAGLGLGGDPVFAREIAAELKELEHRGYSFEGAEASFEMLIRRRQGQQPRFELVDFISLVEQRSGQVLVSEATVKLRVNGVVVHTAAEGNGPVNALDCALRKALQASHPAVGAMQLHDYKVRVLDGTDGTEATVRVLIESGDGEARWSTVGCSTNIIEASWYALADAIEYGLILAEERATETSRNGATAPVSPPPARAPSNKPAPETVA